MSPPLVSVIVPCYNQGEFVAEAVESVLAQTVQDFEILIVNDGSTDVVTPAVLDQSAWPRTQIFHTENRGLAGARNFLITQSQGTYLCALDADDTLAPRYLEAALDAFRHDSTLTFVGSRLRMFGAETRITPDDLTCDLPALLVDCPLFPAALVRRSAVDDLGGYDLQIPGNEDWDLWISLLERGHRGLILPDILFHYRRRPGSLCDVCTRGNVRLEHFRYLVRKHQDSYRAHLPYVLAAKMRALEERQQAIDALASHVEKRRREADTETSQAPFSTDDSAELRREYQRALAEIAALRGSVSWRLTAPLRAAYERLTAARPRAAHAIAATPSAGRAQTTDSGRISGLSQTDAWPMPTNTGDVESVLLSYETLLLAQLDRLDTLRAEATRLPVDFGDLRRSTPISASWGTDRGKPLDRYYIEQFLHAHRQDIQGRVLEVKDAGYTRMFGGERVSTSDVLDIDAVNPLATIVADLAGASGIGRTRFDCFVLTQTLGLIYDVRAALTNAAAALSPGGVLLCTLPASGRISCEPPGLAGDFWRFTEASARRLFADVFPRDAFVVQTYGNVLARAAFLYGLADHELSTAELDVLDPYFPVIYGVRAVRTWP